jgi:DeoR family suf operon transcriptional repressor
METMTPALAAHKGLRGQILLELKKSQPLTALELAERHGVTANAVRRHLKELEAEQLVAYGREQRGQGAPTYTYRLSERGEALFPNRYETELTAVLEYLEKNGGRDAVRRFFEQRFRAQADEILARLGDATMEQRVAAVVEFLRREGFMPIASVDAAGLHLAEHNCAMHAVAQRFPEVCDTELVFLTELLGPGVQRERHIVSGCNACEYAINQGEGDGTAAPPPQRERA